MEQEGSINIYIVGSEKIRPTFIKTFLGEEISSNKEETTKPIIEKVKIGEEKNYTLYIHQVQGDGGIGKGKNNTIKNVHVMIFLYNLSNSDYFNDFLPNKMSSFRKGIGYNYIEIVVGYKIDEKKEISDFEYKKTINEQFPHNVKFFRIINKEDCNDDVNGVISYIVKKVLNLGNYKGGIIVRGKDINHNHKDQFIEEDCGTRCNDFCNGLGDCCFCIFCPCCCCFQ